MRVAVIGSRTVGKPFYELLCEKMPRGVSEIVSGGAGGADMLARQYALEKQLPYKEFRPDYEKYGRAAPLRRNDEIVDYADLVLALWDGRSRGTAYVIKRCLARYTEVQVVFCRESAGVAT